MPLTNACIGRNGGDPLALIRWSPTFDEFGRGSPVTATRAPRPGNGHDDGTARRRWCL